MYYCDECASEKDWPITHARSLGTCELCKKRANCNDRISSLLPIPSIEAEPNEHQEALKRLQGWVKRVRTTQDDFDECETLIPIVVARMIEILGEQKALVYAEHLHPNITYAHHQSPNGLDIGDCILSRGVLVPTGYDAQMNVGVRFFGEDKRGHGKIYLHKAGLPLTEGWEVDHRSTGDIGRAAVTAVLHECFGGYEDDSREQD